jgi:diaminohydroxyphosphoribosylaminopyrimidine deaminase/5-amino-6-(5-phosphoribosylamino)uracil reductase
MATAVEIAAMRRAISLSTDQLGTTNPNPCVGAVVLDVDGAIVGEGVTQPIGGDHAEVGALRAAGDRARGGTVVATLEPCSHSGRTLPCTDVIRAAGVSRVVYALTDPHPAAAGGGRQLADGGIDVEADVLPAEADAVLGRWVTAVARQRTHVTLKYAATLDGRTAAADGSSSWITGAGARSDGHRERALADAVVVGIGTVLADDARLTVRDWPASRQPVRVVVDSNARTPAGAQVLDDTAATLIAVAEGADPDRLAELRAAGAEVVTLPRSAGRVDLAALVAELWNRDVVVALVEGGATLAGAFIRHRLADRLVGYYAPALLGAGTAVLDDLGITTIGDARRLKLEDVTVIDGDVRITARIDQPEVEA